jgi:hypothetical protein
MRTQLSHDTGKERVKNGNEKENKKQRHQTLRAAIWLAFLLCVLRVRSSNHGLDTLYPNTHRRFPQFLTAETTHDKLKTFQISLMFIPSSFDAVKLEKYHQVKQTIPS